MRSVYATATATATAVISTVIAVGKRASNNNNYFNFVDSLNGSFRSSSLRCCCRRRHHHRYIIPSIVTKVGRKGRIRLQNFQTINNTTTSTSARSPATTLFKSIGLLSLQTQSSPLLRQLEFRSIITTSTTTNSVGRGGMLVGIIGVFAIGVVAAAATRIVPDTDNYKNSNIDKNNDPDDNDVNQQDHSTTIIPSPPPPPPRLLVMPSTTSDILLFDAGDYNDDDNKHEQYYEKDHQFHYHAQKKFPFLFYLLKQVKVIKYSEKRDSISITSSSGRNKPTGLVGLACIHCYCLNNNNNNNTTEEQQPSPLQPYGQAIFPQDRRSLAREVKIDLYNHVLNCECCPIKIKQELQQRYCKQQQQQQNLERQQLSSSSLLSSSQKQKNKKKTTPISKEERLFFKKLWFRMGHKEHMQE
jgi:hypothetical protein